MSQPKLSLYYSEKEDDGRSYKNPFLPLPREKGKKQQYATAPSVTTCLKFEGKDDLAQWKVDIVVDWCVQNWATLGSRSDEDAKKTARYRHLDYRDERAQVGTGVHEYLDTLHKGGWDFPDLDDEQQQIVQQFEEFTKVYRFEPLYNEVTFWSHEHDYAGTGDVVAVIEGPGIPLGTYLVDYKTSRKLWNSHWMQLAGLRNCDRMLLEVEPQTSGAVEYVTERDGSSWWLDLPMPHVDGVVALHLRADMWEAVLGDEAEQEIAYKEFLAYRALWGYDRDRKALRKSKEANPW